MLHDMTSLAEQFGVAARSGKLQLVLVDPVASPLAQQWVVSVSAVEDFSVRQSCNDHSQPAQVNALVPQALVVTFELGRADNLKRHRRLPGPQTGLPRLDGSPTKVESKTNLFPSRNFRKLLYSFVVCTA